MSQLDDILARLVEQARLDTCAALIDQGRRIGGDPVGHACCNPAAHSVWRDGLLFRICDPCQQLVQLQPQRVTLPPWRAV